MIKQPHMITFELLLLQEHNNSTLYQHYMWVPACSSHPFILRMGHFYFLVLNVLSYMVLLIFQNYVYAHA